MYRLDKLLKEEGKLFHTNDLALLWGIENRNTLYTTIKRYVKKGILIPIYKGFYATIPLGEIDPLTLGFSLIHQYAYISGEYVLAKEGILFQSSDYITFVSIFSRKFTIGKNNYWVRKLKEEYLFNQAGVEEERGLKIASLERAVADLLYFNPRAYFDNPKKINWTKVRTLQKEVGYK